MERYSYWRTRFLCGRRTRRFFWKHRSQRIGCKTAGVDDDMMTFSGTAKVFQSQEEAMNGILEGKVEDGDVVVLQYEGPQGGPGMQEMLAPTSAIKGKGIRADLLLMDDFQGNPWTLYWTHCSRRKAEGGPFAIVQTGDIIDINAHERSINVQLSDAEIADRLAKLPQWEPKVKRKDGWDVTVNSSPVQIREP